LVLGNRLAERAPDLRVLGREPQRPFGDADAARGDVDASEFEPAGRLVKALALDFPNKMFGGGSCICLTILAGQRSE
jgi:hypothetical protein